MVSSVDASQYTTNVAYKWDVPFAGVDPSSGDNSTVWWSVLVPGPGHLLSDSAQAPVIITMVMMAFSTWLAAIVSVSRALRGSLARGRSPSGARAPGDGPAARWPQGDAAHPPAQKAQRAPPECAGGCHARRHHLHSVNDVYCTVGRDVAGTVPDGAATGAGTTRTRTPPPPPGPGGDRPTSRVCL